MLPISAFMKMGLRERWLAEGGFYTPTPQNGNGSAVHETNIRSGELREASLPKVRIRLKLDQPERISK